VQKCESKSWALPAAGKTKNITSSPASFLLIQIFCTSIKRSGGTRLSIVPTPSPSQAHAGPPPRCRRAQAPAARNDQRKIRAEKRSSSRMTGRGTQTTSERIGSSRGLGQWWVHQRAGARDWRAGPQASTGHSSEDVLPGANRIASPKILPSMNSCHGRRRGLFSVLALT